jgi:SpoVK/Ycf46/Vps4 family AAA+-type ATPase
MGIRNSNAGLTRATDYALEGLNIRGALPLERVIAAVRKFQTESGGTECAGGKDRPRMNLLLCGPPGAGKTEFVKHLGAVLDTKVVVRMGSDLLSMWVGGTEQNIKAAFAEAETEKAILFLDEIDGLVQSRERATRSWEVTQVNELLHQMENFKGVLVGATNFMDNLDPATLRRFTFKIEFDYLDGIGKRLFFERIFGIIPNSAGSTRLDAIGKLTPGDFRTVRQSLYYLDDDIDDHVILEALERECEMKTNPGRDKRSKIGFSNAAPTHPVT